MEEWIKYGIAFLLGTATGAAGNYFATKYTDLRRKKEGIKESRETFRKVIKIMPELIQEMKVDFSNPEFSSVRDLVILPNKKVTFNSAGKLYFRYYEDQHKNLAGKVAILEKNGYIYNVSVSNTPIFRITEEFLKLVENS